MKEAPTKEYKSRPERSWPGRNVAGKIALCKFVGLLLFISISCSEEIGPCHDMEVHSKKLLELSKKTTGVESQQYYQKYLTEKHILENCLATHD